MSDAGGVSNAATQPGTSRKQHVIGNALLAFWFVYTIGAVISTYAIYYGLYPPMVKSGPVHIIPIGFMHLWWIGNGIPAALRYRRDGTRSFFTSFPIVIFWAMIVIVVIALGL